MKDESSVLLLKRFESASKRPDPCPDETVTQLVLAAVPGTDTALASPSEPAEVSPRVMLRLLTYCYAKGTYASGEIERKLRKSPIQQSAPSAKSIQRFRRLHRTALQRALEKTLRRMHCSSADDQTLIIAREASEKLETAAICDISLEE